MNIDYDFIYKAIFNQIVNHEMTEKYIKDSVIVEDCDLIPCGINEDGLFMMDTSPRLNGVNYIQIKDESGNTIGRLYNSLLDLPCHSSVEAWESAAR